MIWKTPLSIVLFAFVALVARRAQGNDPARLTYERDVRPILRTHCFECHGEGEKLKGELDLRLRRLAVKGGKTGPAITPGNRDKSLLYQQVSEGEMPPGKKPKLSAAQVATIGDWIAQGAVTARPEPESVAAAQPVTEEDRAFWSFQPIRTVRPPAVAHANLLRTPIDAFVLVRLEAKQLSFSAEADKATLIRRATFDLTGLPPTPEEVDAFVADAAPDAYERVLDRLLASPRYGERWARHWLDVAGYADSDGYNEADTERKYAWRYRDYVIRSFNDDKPFDQFVVEQLAGDELVRPPHTNLSPPDLEKLTATGFLRMAPDGSAAAGADKKVIANQVIADEIKVVTGGLLGLTVACAQCHDHRYDPIPQADYFRLRAIFEPAFNWRAWRMPIDRLVSLYTDADRAKVKELAAQERPIIAARDRRADELMKEAFEIEVAKLPEDVREPLRKAWTTPLAKRTPEQVKLLKAHPTADITVNSLAKLNKAGYDEFQRMSGEIVKLRAAKPVEEFVEALTEIPGKVPPMHLFYRGDPDQPKQVVSPGELTVLSPVGAAVKIAEKDPALPTTGRRLAYARWLTSGEHPLVGRVLVNRIWMQHFGRGIVGTPGDFGALGERPTHPELLDWLARDFTSNGWRLKRLHKLMMTSSVYRQGSARTAPGDAADPDNHLLGRWSIRRLDAGQVRDAMLSVSGKLNGKMFGPPVPVMPDEVGQIVVGKENANAGRPGAVIPLNGDEFRRSIYIQVRRTRPLSLLAAFDEPAMEPNCEARAVSTATPQALMLMNNEGVVALAGEFARRVRGEAGGDPRAQVRRAWRLAVGGEPPAAEAAFLESFLARQTATYAANLPAAKSPAAPVAKPGAANPPAMPDPALQALASVCQAIWSANAFLYID